MITHGKNASVLTASIEYILSTKSFHALVNNLVLVHNYCKKPNSALKKSSFYCRIFVNSNYHILQCCFPYQILLKSLRHQHNLNDLPKFNLNVMVRKDYAINAAMLYNSFKSWNCCIKIPT